MGGEHLLQEMELIQVKNLARLLVLFCVKHFKHQEDLTLLQPQKITFHNSYKYLYNLQPR